MNNTKVLDEKNKEACIAISQLYRGLRGDCVYILTQISQNKVMLVNLSLGCCYQSQIQVSSVRDITQLEWEKITDEEPENFKRVYNVNITAENKN